MDQGTKSICSDSIVVTGAGACILPSPTTKQPFYMHTDNALDVLPYLRSKKTFKFMGKQDQLAVIAASRAVSSCAINNRAAPNRIGLYLTVGYIPFEKAEIELLAHNSSDQGQFSMELFASHAINKVNPLLTFRCLSNMPAFHISANLGITGPYAVSYPGVGQTYVALEQAMQALRDGHIDLALVGGVADQDNFLVQRHLNRLSWSEKSEHLDAAAIICLERLSSASQRGAPYNLRLLSKKIAYDAPNPFVHIPVHNELMRLDNKDLNAEKTGWLGPASLPAALTWQINTRANSLDHEVYTCDGITASSSWRFS